MSKLVDARRDKESRFVIHGMGTGLLIMAFIAVCLITFAVLAYVTAINDYRSSQALANMQLEYYQVCNEAEKVEQEIDEARSRGAVLSQIVISDGRIVEPIYTDEGFSFRIPIDDKRTFEAEAKYDGEGGYKIVKWHVVQ